MYSFVIVCNYVRMCILSCCTYVCLYVGEHLVQALPFVPPLHFVIKLLYNQVLRIIRNAVKSDVKDGRI